MVQPGIDTADHADLVNPIDKIGAQASPAHEPQQLQGGNGSEASRAARQGTHVHAAGVVRDDRHHQLVVVPFKLDMDALIGPDGHIGGCRAGRDAARLSR
jgi:hypothetical protein